MEFAGVLQDVEPDAIPTYQIEAVGRTIGGADVLEPRIEGDNMQAVLAMFRGETSLADAPVQLFEPTTSAAARTDAPPATRPARPPRRDDTRDAAPADHGRRRPRGEHVGIVPPRDVTCP